MEAQAAHLPLACNSWRLAVGVAAAAAGLLWPADVWCCKLFSLQASYAQQTEY